MADAEKNIINYFPRHLEQLAELSLTTVLSPLITDIIKMSSTINMIDNKTFSDITIRPHLDLDDEYEIEDEGGNPLINEHPKSGFYDFIHNMMHSEDDDETMNSRDYRAHYANNFQLFSKVMIDNVNDHLYRIIHQTDVPEDRRTSINTLIYNAGEQEEEVEKKLKYHYLMLMQNQMPDLLKIYHRFITHLLLY